MQRRDRARLDRHVLAILRDKLRPADLAAVEAMAQAQLDAEAVERSQRARAARQRRLGS